MYKNRIEAGQLLAEKLKGENFISPIVFGIPRGGVVIAKEIARELKAPMNMVVTRKLGTPFNPELGFGAIAPNKVVVYNENLLAGLDISEKEMKEVEDKEQKELIRRMEEYGAKKMGSLKGKTAILADDGIATGFTVLAAIKYLQSLKPEEIVVTAPVCAQDSSYLIRNSGAKLICLEEPLDFQAVGQFYEYFPQTSDSEVKKLLKG